MLSICTRCHCPFTPRRSDARYCSAACGQQAYRLRIVSAEFTRHFLRRDGVRSTKLENLVAKYTAETAKLQAAVLAAGRALHYPSLRLQRLQLGFGYVPHGKLAWTAFVEDNEQGADLHGVLVHLGHVHRHRMAQAARRQAVKDRQAERRLA